MSIKMIKKNLIRNSLLAILTGTLLIVAGFGMMGFDFQRLKDDTKTDVWYQTIHLNSKQDFWYGVNLGDDIYLFVIGDSE